MADTKFTILNNSNSVTVTNKSIDSDDNIITDIVDADIKVGAAIDATKIADGSVTSTEFQYLSGVTSDIQTQLNAAATDTDLSNHEADTTNIHGIADTSVLVTTTGSQSLTNKTINASSNTVTNVSLTSAVTGTLPVDNGGTGLASTTAYAVLCGGTTTTNPLQSIASVGTSGQVLTSNGAGFLPTFQNPGALNGYTFGSRQVFTSSGTWNKPADCLAVNVIVVGGGGGSAGANSAASEGSVGGAGGGGGTSIKFITSGLGSSETITIGAGGTAGASSGTGGGNGGTSSFGAHCSATGGEGGNAQVSGTAAARGGTPGDGGIGSSGDINIKGSPGFWGFRNAATVFVPSHGGNSYLGGGGYGNNANSGTVGGNYGGGAGGSSSTNNTDQAGAVGGPGIIIVDEYY